MEQKINIISDTERIRPYKILYDICVDKIEQIYRLNTGLNGMKEIKKILKKEMNKMNKNTVKIKNTKSKITKTLTKAVSSPKLAVSTKDSTYKRVGPYIAKIAPKTYRVRVGRHNGCVHSLAAARSLRKDLLTMRNELKSA